MAHQETYRHNEAYAAFLENWNPGFYGKYTDTLKPNQAQGRILDVGCGVGQVVGRLHKEGYEAYGVEVSESNLTRAKEQCPRCQWFDGKRLPFPDKHFASVGALNVLEHVEEPEAFIQEMVRVTEPQGRIVISSPNFFRVIGLRDYHRQMRGIGTKLCNAWRLFTKWRQIRTDPEHVRFDRMEPIFKEPFTPDDDAIVATNPLEISFFLRQNGCRIETVLCTDRYVTPLIDRLLNLTPFRYLMFNAFVIAHRSADPSR